VPGNHPLGGVVDPDRAGTTLAVARAMAAFVAATGHVSGFARMRRMISPFFWGVFVLCVFAPPPHRRGGPGGGRGGAGFFFFFFFLGGGGLAFLIAPYGH